MTIKYQIQFSLIYNKNIIDCRLRKETCYFTFISVINIENYFLLDNSFNNKVSKPCAVRLLLLILIKTIKSDLRIYNAVCRGKIKK